MPRYEQPVPDDIYIPEDIYITKTPRRARDERFDEYEDDNDNNGWSDFY